MKLVNLSSRLASKENFLDAAALFDVLLIALMFTLLSSRFVLAPGISVELVSPNSGTPDFALADADLTVLNAKSGNMLIFDGAVFTPKSFGEKMRRDAKSGTQRSVLLLKADKSVNTQILAQICRDAKIGGFKTVQIATTGNTENF